MTNYCEGYRDGEEMTQQRIAELEQQLAEQRRLLQRWYDDIHVNKDHSLWDDTEALLEGESDDRLHR